MTSPFDRRFPTFRELLDNLRLRSDCGVILQDAGGIPDSSGGVSGALYLIERGELFAYLEVFHDDVLVLPDVVRSLCKALDLDEGDVTRTPSNS